MSSATTLTTGWTITRRDDVTEAYTAHDRDIVAGGVNYQSAAAYAPSAIARTSDLEADNQRITGVTSEGGVSPVDLIGGLYAGARVEFVLLDYRTSTVVRSLLVGHIGKVEMKDKEYIIHFDSIEEELKKPIGRVFSLRCDADLGDTRCGYDLVPDNCTVTAVTEVRRVFTDTELAKPDGYYNGGKILWSTGANAGLTSDIKRYLSASGTIDLFEPLPADIQPGDVAEITRGCDKLFSTCRDTFENKDNFRGYPYIPGISDVVDGRS